MVLDIITGVLERDTLAPYLFLLCIDYVLRTLKDLIEENDFSFKKRYPAETLTGADYTDDLEILVNIAA